ncbi:MAG: hypothetical protein FJW30_08985 [Acidobacteria bacterium]|nr:hypothetical protein [Acidobacteriota bacterium]
MGAGRRGDPPCLRRGGLGACLARLASQSRRSAAARLDKTRQAHESYSTDKVDLNRRKGEPRNRPPSEQTVAPLVSLAQDPAAWWHGFDLCRQSGLKAGTLYPILTRLVDRNWLEAAWEKGSPTGARLDISTA